MAVDRGRRVQRRHDLRVPRRHERAPARGDPRRVRGDGLARAPHASRGAARRSAHAHTARPPTPRRDEGQADADDLRTVEAARRPRRGHPPGRAARRRHAAGRARAVQRRGGRASGGGRGPAAGRSQVDAPHLDVGRPSACAGRRRTDAPDPRQPHRQRRQVLARRQQGRRRGAAGERPRSLYGSRPRPGDPGSPSESTSSRSSTASIPTIVRASAEAGSASTSAASSSPRCTGGSGSSRLPQQQGSTFAFDLPIANVA